MRRDRSAVRRLAAALLAALATAGGLVACTSPSLSVVSVPPPRTDGRPNIVFILTDDLSTNLLPYLPRVQALMRSGTTLRNYFVADSLCCPSRSAIFTGLYPHDDGVFKNTGPDGGYAAYNEHGNESKSFAVALKRAGYYTGIMGKYLNGYAPTDPPAPGWDVWDVAGNGYYEYNYLLNENGNQHAYGRQPQDYLTNVLSDKAVEFIANAKYTGKPFALEISTFAPHRPWVPAPQDIGTVPTLQAPRLPPFDRKPTDAPYWLADLEPLTSTEVSGIDESFRRRVEAVQAVDRMIGRVEKAVAREGQLNNTYFVFSSDNGFHMGEYGLLPGKQTAFDTDIRVPLVIAGPGVPAGRTINAMASSIDLAPTFLQIGHAAPSDEPDGVSLLDLLHGDRTPANWQRAVLIEHHGPDTDPTDPDLQPRRAGLPPSYEAMRSATSLYVEYVTGEREYYDLVRDPYELHNMVGRLSPQRLAQLHTRLLGLVNCHGAAECQRAAAAPKV